MSKPPLLVETAPRIDPMLDYFGGDSVTEIYHDNSRIAQGAFGEISLAMYEHPSDEEQDVDDDNNKKINNSDTQKRRPRLRQVVAVKTLFQSTVSNRASWGTTSSSSSEHRTLSPEAFHEIWALRLLNPHANIVRLLAMYPSRGNGDVVTAGSSLSFAFEYAPCDLHLALEWRRRSFCPLLSLAVVRTIARDLLSALQHCHSHGVLHRDVKCGNLLVSSSTGRIQLCDFGLAKPAAPITLLEQQKQQQQPSSPSRKPSSSNSSSSGGYLNNPLAPSSSDPQQQQSRGLCTLPYRPPEVLLGGAATHSSVDVYSAGVVIAELVNGNGGRHLFHANNVVSQLLCVFDALGTPSDQHWPGARLLPDYGKLHFASKEPKLWSELIPRSDECKHLPEFLSSCIALDPDQRWSCAALLNHAWLVAEESSRDNNGDFFFADRQTLIRELVPSELDEPILLTGTDSSRVILSLAARHRNLLSNLVEQMRSKIIVQ